MNLLLTPRDVLSADREATHFTMQPLSLLTRLFGNRKLVDHEAAVRDFDQIPLSPIEVVEEITDNRHHLSRLLGEMTDLLGQSLHDTSIFALLQQATQEDVERVVLEDGEEFLPPDQYELDRMVHWLDADVLPSDIRRQLLEMHVRLDDLSEDLAGLSQTRWERLKLWSGRND